MKDIIQQELESIFTDGLLRPEKVIIRAKNPENILHKYFEWDDTKAAHQHRLEQARSLIRSVTITHPEHKEVVIQAFVSLPSDRENGGGYRKVEEVMTNDFMRVQFFEEISRAIESWERKAAIIGLCINLSPLRKIAKRIAK